MLSTTSASTNSKKLVKANDEVSNVPISFENLSMKDFKLIKDLGSGSYGEVSLVNLHNRLFALK